MAAADADQRSDIASLAARTRWGSVADRKAATRPARDGLIAKFEAEIPDSVTDPVQRESMLAHKLAAHMLKMRLARARRRAGEVA